MLKNDPFPNMKTKVIILAIRYNAVNIQPLFTPSKDAISQSPLLITVFRQGGKINYTTEVDNWQGSSMELPMGSLI